MESRKIPATIPETDIRADRRRDVDVGDESHGELVDAHAEGNGGDHDHAVLGKETVLVPVGDRLIHAGMVGQPGAPSRGQALRHSLGCLARLRVSDAGLPEMPVQQVVDLSRSRTAGRHADPQVPAVESGGEDLCSAAEQPRATISCRTTASTVVVKALNRASGKCCGSSASRR
ncbi:MAG: hypothetical protein OXL68_01425 [Paracoccaceae bacterium]|nr:hypothetical protein [Paracoccaceae bacterium]